MMIARNTSRVRSTICHAHRAAGVAVFSRYSALKARGE